MLQQTQVETVLPYYTRFLERFPTLEALARSSEEEILALWSGLGYYSRARNLRRAAQRVAAEHGGRIPDDFDSLIQLPGVGRYMAGAIMSIAFNEPFPIVDGNVRRVLSRRNGWTEPGDAQLWEAAERIARDGNPQTVNQAMMELGATVCTFRTPRCEQCPLKPNCIARGTGQQANMPAPRKRRQTVRVDLYAVVDSNRNGFLMREDASMWEFPLLTDPPGTGFTKIGACRHSITHHRLEVEVYTGKLSNRRNYRRVRFEDVPVTSLTRKIHSFVGDRRKVKKSGPSPHATSSGH